MSYTPDDQLSHDASVLALACVYWRLACIPRPLSPDSPAEEPDPYWDSISDKWHNAAWSLARTVKNHKAVLDLLRTNSEVRILAANLVLNIEGRTAFPLTIKAFGPGWREHGFVNISEQGEMI